MTRSELPNRNVEGARYWSEGRRKGGQARWVRSPVPEDRALANAVLFSEGRNVDPLPVA